MARFLLLLAFCAILAGLVMMVASATRRTADAVARGMPPGLWERKDETMASSGLQKAAFIALIVILIGVATGWLGGL